MQNVNILWAKKYNRKKYIDFCGEKTEIVQHVSENSEGIFVD
jgi:hypothetical protein